jgi:hypothetical protein
MLDAHTKNAAWLQTVPRIGRMSVRKANDSYVVNLDKGILENAPSYGTSDDIGITFVS